MERNTVVIVNGREMKFGDYLGFMYNENNIRNCSQCPENRDWDSGNALPCGEYNCWVRLHCRRN